MAQAVNEGAPAKGFHTLGELMMSLEGLPPYAPEPHPDEVAKLQQMINAQEREYMRARCNVPREELIARIKSAPPSCGAALVEAGFTIEGDGLGIVSDTVTAQLQALADALEALPPPGNTERVYIAGEADSEGGEI